MASNEYLSFKEWATALEHLCMQRLKVSLVNRPDITIEEMQDAWHDGATPEEFFVTDVDQQMKPFNSEERR